MHHPHHVVVAEGEAGMRTELARSFASDGYRVSVAADFAELSGVLAANDADLIGFDIALPGKDGLSMLRRLRASDDWGIIVFGAVADAADRLRALEMGADDFLTKPVDARELLARARNILRRARTAQQRASIAFGGWHLDRASRELRDRSGRRAALTRGEFDLLLALADRPERVLSRAELVKALGHRSTNPTERTVDVMIGRLRRKLEDDAKKPKLIQTRHGAGYVLCPDRTADVSKGRG